MIAVPWYLLAAGVVLVIVGYLLAGASGSSRSRHQPIHHKMRDEDIINHLNRQEALPTSAVVTLLGYVLVLVSIAWRLVGVFV